MILALVAICAPLGDTCLSRGMTTLPAISLAHPITLIAAVFTPWIALGIALLIGFFASYMTALSWADLTFVMPATALVLPLFLEANAVHAVGTPLAVILPFSFFPFGVYLAYIFYSSSVPKDLLAAARIDGCNEWDVFRRIALPLARPIIALVTFFAFVANWNNFFLPFVMLPNSTNYPLPIGLQDLLSATPAFNPGQGGQVLGHVGSGPRLGHHDQHRVVPGHRAQQALQPTPIEGRAPSPPLWPWRR